MKNKLFPLLILIFIVLAFFYQFFLYSKLPIPSDTIVGMYYPYRDFYSKDYPRGIPFKNFLITDPVRQQYVWRDLVTSAEKKLNLPLWNPYSFSGTPLLANQQSASFNIFNLLLFFLSQSFGWSLLILIQPLLGSIFMYLYLNNLRLKKTACFLGSLVFAFGGFSIAWLEWGTIGYVVLWLPLVLLSIDKIFIKNYNKLWLAVYIFSMVFSFFGGHLQASFYFILLSFLYLLARWIQNGKSVKSGLVFLIAILFVLIITSIQWIPTFQFISQSGRSVDQIVWQKEGWFLPWQNLIQFVIPDFFGNPATLNYWGIWNYAEFIGYVGILPLIMAIFALVYRKDKKTLFFGVVLFISIFFSLSTLLGKIPYQLNIPFISTSQPTRLLFLVDFSLAVLAAFGLDYFLKSGKKITYPLICVAIFFILTWLYFFIGNNNFKLILQENLEIAKRNTVFPTIIFLISAIILCLFMHTKKTRVKHIMILCILIIVIVDLFRFGLKFTPFTEEKYLFPTTKTTSFLSKQEGLFRIMAVDKKILPPNFSINYRLQDISGYDPLFIKRYGELIAASERNRADISLPLGFNRIITPQRFDSKIIDLLGVKYILSLSELNSPKLEKVLEEGETKTYKNNKALPRIYYVNKVIASKNGQETLNYVFDPKINLSETAIVEDFSKTSGYSKGNVKIISYSEEKIVIETKNNAEGFLVFNDVYYPSWHAKIGNNETKIYLTNYSFRGIIVPSGNQIITFIINL